MPKETSKNVAPAEQQEAKDQNIQTNNSTAPEPDAQKPEAEQPAENDAPAYQPRTGFESSDSLGEK